jgi:hypothetical protein
MALGALGAIPGAGDAAVSGIRQGARRAAAEVATQNYLEPVSRHTPTLFRETSPDDAMNFLPHGNSHASLGQEDLYFADSPDLAIGQGRNRGVLMEFDAADLRGQVNTGKPAWAPLWDQGQGEYILRHNRQSQYQGALRAITIRPDAQTQPAMRERLNRAIRWHEQRGWTRTLNPDGSIILRRPE